MEAWLDDEESIRAIASICVRPQLPNGMTRDRANRFDDKFSTDDNIQYRNVSRGRLDWRGRQRIPFRDIYMDR